MDDSCNNPFSSSDFTSGTEAEVFEKIAPLPDAGSTTQAYIVRIKGQDFFMKRLRPELQQAERYRNLFRKEFKLGQQLASPYIVGYNALVDNERETYILRENVVGCTLKEKLSSSPEWFLEKKNMRRFMLQLLSALQHLHEHHVVHADLKPENVMLTRINNDVKLIDLGFAFSDNYTSSTGCTLQFAAPEQKNGGQLDARTDIYAFGLLINYIYKEVGSKPPRLWAGIANKCLQQAPKQRFQSAEEISTALLRRRRLLLKWSMAISIAALVGGAMYVIPNTYIGGEFIQEVEWVLQRPDYDFEAKVGFYRFNSADSSTVAMVGAKRNNSIWAQTYVEHKGRRLKLTSIGDRAFYKATHLEALHLPEGLDTIGYDALAHSGIIMLNLPKSLRHIKENAFRDMKNLKTIRLNEGIRYLPYGMAHHCPNLRTIFLPNSVKILPADMLAFCTKLEHVRLPDSLQAIERGTFWHCHSLTEMKLPETVERIAEYAFFHCSNLKRLVLPRLTPPNMTRSFNTGTQLVVYVPKEAVEVYRDDPEWGLLRIESLESLKESPLPTAP
ncbi:MAG: leucine-rich repeat protein [Bacteroidaceae bacterium]|nr:leucine-rich repeat protein [Bacteroidaceae bacterium]